MTNPYANIRLKDPKCEYTAPGAETDAIDCKEGPLDLLGRTTRARATRRHVNDEGKTIGLFCDKHSNPNLREVAEVEYIPSRASGLIF